MKTEAGKLETYYIDRRTGTAHKVLCVGKNSSRIKATRAVARALIGGGGCIFIYSGSARLVSFEIKLISKEATRAEPEYMNITPPPPPISVLVTVLKATVKF